MHNQIEIPISFRITTTATAGNPKIATTMMVSRLYAIPRLKRAFTRYIAIRPSMLFSTRPRSSFPSLRMMNRTTMIAAISTISDAREPRVMSRSTTSIPPRFRPADAQQVQYYQDCHREKPEDRDEGQHQQVVPYAQAEERVHEEYDDESHDRVDQERVQQASREGQDVDEYQDDQDQGQQQSYPVPRFYLHGIAPSNVPGLRRRVLGHARIAAAGVVAALVVACRVVSARVVSGRRVAAARGDIGAGLRHSHDVRRGRYQHDNYDNSCQEQ